MTYAVTFEASGLSLVPSVFGAEIMFTGDLDLEARPSGVWEVEDIWIATATPAADSFLPNIGKVRMSRSDPLFPIIVVAARAFDQQTGDITAQVRAELLESAARAHADDIYDLRLQAAE